MKWKIVSWNVNGIRSIVKKDELYELIDNEKPDVLCFGETKLSCPFEDTEEEMKKSIKGYKYRYWSPCLVKKGYSGTAIFAKRKPISVCYGFEEQEKEDEGRGKVLEYDHFYLLHVYSPNSGIGLKRLDYRVNTWDKKLSMFVEKLVKSKPIIVTGDMNVAHKEIDIHNPKRNLKNPGFTIEERTNFTKFLQDNNLVDSYRHLNPENQEYSFWKYQFNARAKNIGWRLDYFLISEPALKWVRKSEILTQIMGSDHAPISLTLNVS